MMPGKISQRVASDRLAWVDKMLGEIRALPLESKEAFLSDSRNVSTAESCLRRALEALFDLGRHVLAKGFAVGVTEYKEIATALRSHQVLLPHDADLMRILAGYRNRMVHFYHEVSADELYEICTSYLGDVDQVTNALRHWLNTNQDRMDGSL